MNKKSFRLIVVSAGLIVAFILAAPARRIDAGPNPNADVSGFCTANNDLGRSHGECVSIGETHVNALEQRGVTDGVTICRILQQALGPFPLGNCVSHFAGS